MHNIQNSHKNHRKIPLKQPKAEDNFHILSFNFACYLTVYKDCLNTKSKRFICLSSILSLKIITHKCFVTQFNNFHNSLHKFVKSG